MRKLISTLCMVCLWLAMQAQNSITLSSGSGHPGDEVTLSLSMTNADEVTALEVIIPLGGHLDYVGGSCSLNAERKTDHAVSAAMVEDDLKIYLYSPTLAPLKGNSGEVLTFKLKCGKEPATYALQPQVILGNAAGQSIESISTAGEMTLLSPKLEIQTPTIDYGRVPIRSSYTQTLMLCNVGNEPLSVTDIVGGDATLTAEEKEMLIGVGETKYVTLNYSPVNRGTFTSSVEVVSDAVNGARQKAKVVAEPFSVNELYLSSTSGVSDTEVTLNVSMKNMEPIVALQCDIPLNDALVYVDGSAQMAERGASHSVTANVLDNTLRLLVMSDGNTPLAGNEGDVLSFRLRLNGSSGYYWLDPQNVILGNVTMENMTSATYGGSVEISSPSINSDESLSFGDCQITADATVDYVVRNNGSAPLTIERVLFLSEGYSVATELPKTVEPWAEETVKVVYKPTEEGEFKTTMQIYSNDPTCRMKSVTVSGRVYEPNEFVLSSGISADGKKRLAIGMNNYSEIVALQFDLNGSFISEFSDQNIEKTDRLTSHSVVVNKMNDTKYRFIVYSFGNAVISGNAGELFSVVLDDLTQDVNVTVDNIIIGSKNSEDKNSVGSVTHQSRFVTLSVDGGEHGTVVGGDEFLAGSQVTLTATPHNESEYMFKEWSNGMKDNPLTFTLTSDMTVSAVFAPKMYTLKYIVDGVVVDSSSVVYGTALTPMAEPTKEGNTFSGWSDVPATMPAEDVTITGSFTINSYVLKYVVDGVVVDSSSVVYGTALTPIAEPAKEGNTFSGWSDVPATMPAEDVTITGSFTINTYKVTYVVDGEEYKTVDVVFGETIPAEEAPTKDGYEFSGWSEIPETMPAENITVTGSFSKVNGIIGVSADTRVDVYNLNGMKVANKIAVKDLRTELEDGVYIINGKKYFIK